jgi:hypothetical protein
VQVVKGVDQSDSGRKIVLPPDVTPDHVLGLLELLRSLGSGIDSMYVGDAIGEDVGMLPHAIDVAEALELVAQKGGNLELTERGKRVAAGNPKTVKNLLREVALKLEPIAEVVEQLRRKGELLVEEFESIIRKYYPSRFEEAIQNVLVWGAYLGLFKMDEDDEKILPIRLPHAKKSEPA